MTQNDKKLSKAKIPWESISKANRKLIVWSIWFITWIGLMVGFFHRIFYDYVVVFSAVHTLLFFILFQYHVKPFPVQLRIIYLAWVLVGTYVPHMVILMYITTVGLASNLFLNYCPLARMMYLLPWNREESFSLNLLMRVILTPPVPGRFKPIL